MSENVNGNKDMKLDLIEIEKEYKEMIQKAEKEEKISKEEYNKLVKEAESSTEFLKLLEEIQIPDGKHVIFTDGDLQLVYENGEFFLVSAMDSTSEKKKITRKKAINLNLEYFIKYQINPIIEARRKAMRKKEKNKIRSQTIKEKDKKIGNENQKDDRTKSWNEIER